MGEGHEVPPTPQLLLLPCLMRPTMPKSMNPTRPSGSTSRLPACTSAAAAVAAKTARGSGRYQQQRVGEGGSRGRAEAAVPQGKAGQAASRVVRVAEGCGLVHHTTHTAHSHRTAHTAHSPAWNDSHPTTLPTQVLSPLMSTSSGSTAAAAGAAVGQQE